MTISVVMPAFEAEAVIPTALASLVAQTRPPDEVIVVDDGSTDSTSEVARAFDPLLPIQIVTILQNEGVGAARRAGVAAATSTAVAFVDSDDFALPGHLATLERLHDRPETIVTTQFYSWTPGRPIELRPTGERMPPVSRQRQMIYEGDFVLNACLFSKELYEAAGGSRQFRVAEDWYLMINMISAGARVVRSDDATLLYRQRQGSLTKALRTCVLADIEVLQDHIARLDGRLAEVARASLRRREAKLMMLDAIAMAVDGRRAAARLLHLRAAAHDRSFRRMRQPFNGSVTAASLVGVISPARGQTAAPPEVVNATANSNCASVAVVIPAYEAEPYIATALASLVGQTHQPDEVIVADDASLDRTAEVAETFGDLLNLRIVRRAVNAGPGIARRDAVELATSDTIALLDADDCWLPDHLERMLDAYDGPETIVSASALYWRDDRVVGPVRQEVPEPAEQRKAVLGWNFVFGGSLFSREACIAAGNFSDYRAAEDWDLWIKMIRAGATVVPLKGPTVLYRKHSSSVSAGDVGCIPQDIELLESLLVDSTGADRRQLRRAVRGRRALVDLLAARESARSGNLAQARRLYVRAAMGDRSLSRTASENGSTTVRGLVGVVVPTIRTKRASLGDAPVGG